MHERRSQSGKVYSIADEKCRGNIESNGTGQRSHCGRVEQRLPIIESAEETTRATDGVEERQRASLKNARRGQHLAATSGMTKLRVKDG